MNKQETRRTLGKRATLRFRMEADDLETIDQMARQRTGGNRSKLVDEALARALLRWQARRLRVPARTKRRALGSSAAVTASVRAETKAGLLTLIGARGNLSAIVADVLSNVAVLVRKGRRAATASSGGTL